MIPTRQFDPEFLSMLKQYIDKTPISLTELMAAIRWSYNGIAAIPKSFYLDSFSPLHTSAAGTGIKPRQYLPTYR